MHLDEGVRQQIRVEEVTLFLEYVFNIHHDSTTVLGWENIEVDGTDKSPRPHIRYKIDCNK